ncbi:MAG: hypothetical protein KA155_01240 [Alphaproteobacteria bacterium]|jgi:histone H3/H4|nr:hypothetical protein [Alphaproteobacteria bacterium]
MTQFSSLTAIAITDAVFPQNARNSLFWPRMKRNLGRMHFNESAIQEVERVVEGCAFEVMAEQYGEISYEDGEKVYNCKDVKYERDDQSPSGFTANNQDYKIRVRQQDFIDVLDFKPRVREKFIQALNGNSEAAKNNITETMVKSAPTAPSQVTETGRPKRLIMINSLPIPA